jgi:hypothetical protein
MKRGLRYEVPERRHNRSAVNVKWTSRASTSELQTGECEIALAEISLNDPDSEVKNYPD